MYLYQILVPVNSRNGKRVLEKILLELKKKFGGVTSYSRAPAEGLWEKKRKETVKDLVVVVETMAEEKDAHWWKNYRRTLERRLSQEEIIIRVLPSERI